MNTLIVIIRSAIFNIVFIVWTVGWSALCLPITFLPSKKLHKIVARPWSVVSTFLLKIICGIEHEIRGLENIPKEACILACKHQSAWETIIFFQVTDHPCFVLKKELISLPLFGNQLKAMDSIVVDRKAGKEAVPGMINQSIERLADGISIVIFPEGTRTPIGTTKSYKKGVGSMYLKCNAPVVPIALNSGKFWGRNAFIKRPGKIIMEIMPPIEPGLRTDQFMDLLAEKIDTKSEELLK